MKKQQPNVPEVQFIEVDAEFDRQRIDNFLFTRLKGVPKSRIYRMLRTGEVRVNRGRAQAKTRLNTGDMIRVPPVRTAEGARNETLPAGFLSGVFEAGIIFEDEHLLVLNKPSGVPVHGGSGISGGVIEGLRRLRPEARFLELAHRLDRDTSGCLIIAKRRSALLSLHEQFRSDRVDKRYLTLLAGTWNRKRVTIDARLLKNVRKGGERMVTPSVSGKPAETDFTRLRKFRSATLVQARPKTGRTHQIRVHAAYMGHPIVGDMRYGDDSCNRDFRRKGLKRLFLHAEGLSFSHPATGQPMQISAPLEKGLTDFIETFDETPI
ncbi:MAG: 23S rRNA pseudouridine(955/2504/2580) synthase RluC [Pseudomonadota bacterium]